MVRTKLLALDRDGTLIVQKHYLSCPEDIELLPRAVDALRRFQNDGYRIVLVTNQSGVGRGYFDEEQLSEVHAELTARLREAGIELDGIYYCPHAPEQDCACRKPAPGLLEAALRDAGVHAHAALVVGDKECDIELGRRLGVRTALVRTGYGVQTERSGHCGPDVVVDDLWELAERELSP